MKKEHLDQLNSEVKNTISLDYEDLASDSETYAQVCTMLDQYRSRTTETAPDKLSPIEELMQIIWTNPRRKLDIFFYHAIRDVIFPLKSSSSDQLEPETKLSTATTSLPSTPLAI